jgi:hypothetical protein
MKHLLIKVGVSTVGIAFGSGLFASDSAQAAVMFPGNGHYYDFIQTISLNWTAAKADAESLTFMGQQGYLATITSQAEQDFITANFPFTNAWIGASDQAVEGKWIWETGPEAGTQFWDGGPGGMAVGGQYNNWTPGFEPNNVGPGGEDFAHLRADVNQTWNDLTDEVTFGISGYIIEYGGLKTPEPVSVISLLALGTLGISSAMKRKLN